jgi:hypothetical protein
MTKTLNQCRALLVLLLAMRSGLVLAQDHAPPANPRNQIIVSSHGPTDGGDFGPNTPGTKTSGLQEALDAAKARAMDVYIAGGSWTADKTTPVVYNLDTTLHVPWMQNFRLDSGHCVLNYTQRAGDAIVFDSQMSCAYRLGLVVSLSDGAVVRLKPTTAGPDRFKVITSTEFTINALVGGGGAWPGGEPHKNELDKSRRWIGTGLWLDGSEGSIDANKITVIETVGCGVGLLLTGRVSRNTIEETNIHLSGDHICIGGPHDALPSDNRIEAFMDCQGIEASAGAIVFGRSNMFTLSSRAFPKGLDLVFEKSAIGNLAIMHSPVHAVDRSLGHTNRVIAAGDSSTAPADVPVPPSGQPCRNDGLAPMEIRILTPGRVRSWSELAPEGKVQEIRSPLFAGQSIILRPGESIVLDYAAPPTWRWKEIR